ncbi:MAG: exodeoxyribonuclease VII large subunit [Campylobacterales bacterium]|nr:exodeoxyribonuclease VII large subunit [Campylobacterales bacterium]
MHSPLSVTEINNQIKSLLEATFYKVVVAGEISNLTYHSSGHIYFSLKDENSSIKCTLFKGNASRLKFKLEEGMQIIADGAISIYTPRGEYNLNCFKIEPVGIGSLALAYEQLKEKLEKMGYFDKKYKKEIPKIISHVAIVSSSTGAAIQDMLKVAQKRWNLIKITLIDTIVQGENCAIDIANSIKKADTLKADVIIVGRGGGSIEDLWGFNEEIVAKAIFEAKTPIISAVGHEVDYLISDFVADLRAPTPSAAIEMILRDKYEYLIYIDTLINQFENRFKQIIDLKSKEINSLKEQFLRNSIENKMAKMRDEITQLATRFNKIKQYNLNNFEKPIFELKANLSTMFNSAINNKFQQLNSLKALYESNNPTHKTKTGYAQIVKNQKIVGLKDIKVDEIFVLEDINYIIEAKSLSKTKMKGKK